MNEHAKALANIYKDYKDRLNKLILEKTGNVGESVKRMIGMGTVKNSPLHIEFYENVKNECDLALPEIARKKDAEGAADIVRTIVCYDRTGLDTSIILGFISAEALAIPFVEFMETDKVRSIYEFYIAAYKKNEMMPKQYELYKVLASKSGAGKVKDKKYLLGGDGAVNKRKFGLFKRKGE